MSSARAAGGWRARWPAPWPTERAGALAGKLPNPHEVHETLGRGQQVAGEVAGRVANHLGDMAERLPSTDAVRQRGQRLAGEVTETLPSAWRT